MLEAARHTFSIPSAVNYLAAGQIMGIAPSPGKELNSESIEKGAAYIALGASKKTSKPIEILPIRLKGFEDPVKLLLNRCNPVEAEIFKPISVSFDSTRSLKEQAETLIAKLLNLFSQPTRDKSDKI